MFTHGALPLPQRESFARQGIFIATAPIESGRPAHRHWPCTGSPVLGLLLAVVEATDLA